MNFEEAIDFIHSIPKFGRTPSLNRIKILMEKLGNPQDSLEFIHVAGTNGKGSTTTLIASMLEAKGLTVGKFTSPFILEFRDRITVNGQMIPKEDLIEIVSTIKNLPQETEDNAPREFDVVTAIGLWYFAKVKCDLVVLEVGLGGRYDATNIVKPLACVITPIHLDHTQFLGDTVAQIAKEKAGIIKDGVPVVVTPYQCPEALDVLKDVAGEKNTKVITGEIAKFKVGISNINGSEFTYKDQMYKLKLIGDFQLGNAVTAIEAVEVLPERLLPSQSEREKGLAKAFIPCRMEVLKLGEKTVILDGGHNPHGVQGIVTALQNIVKGDITAVIGMVGDKNCHQCMKIFADVVGKLYVTTPEIYRGLPSGELKDIGADYFRDIVDIGDNQKAVETALADSDLLLVSGSLYLVSDVRKILVEKGFR